MNMLRIFALALLSLTFLPAQAQRLVVSPQASTGLYVLSYLGETQGDLTVRIKDSEGTVIHRESIEERSRLSRAYRLTQTQAGNYTFEVIGPDGNLQQTVAYPIVQPLDVALIGSSRDNRYQLRLDSPADKELTVRIYDEDMNLLHESHGRPQEHAQRVYNLSQVPARSVTFSVASDYQVVSRQVELR